MQSKSTLTRWKKISCWVIAAISVFLVSTQQSIAQTERAGKLRTGPAAAVKKSGSGVDGKASPVQLKGSVAQSTKPALASQAARLGLKNALANATTKAQYMAAYAQYGTPSFGSTPSNEAYCSPTTTSTGFEFVTNVTYAGINNSTTGGPGGPKDYTAQTATVTQGQNTSISVTIDPDGDDFVWALIDWNHNEIWDLATERFLVAGPTAAAGPHTATIAVPAGALTGPTRMRVAVVWGATVPANDWNGCTSYTFGEVEDYTVNVLPNTACSGTPTPGNTISSAASACAGTTVNLSLQNATGSGATYQWQSGPSATGPWTNVGTSSPTYATTITANTWFQAVVTCGPNSGTSTPVLVSLNPFYLCYCAAGSPDLIFEKISNVTYGTINNSSSSTGGYENFSAISTNAIRSAAQSISVSISNGFDADQVLVWIDFNQNGSFSDAGELVYTSALGVGPHTGSITIPATALLGTTGMRVRLHDSSLGPNSTPCGNSSYGQVEDYTVNIVPCPAGTGTPTPGNTISTSGTGFCIATPFTLSMQNPNSVPATYQWQSSPDGTTWTNIAGATSATYTTTLTTATYFHVVVTSCNGNVGTSTNLQLTPNPFLQCYCVPPADDCTDDDVITRFRISSLDNVSACSPNGFGDYKATIPATPLYIGVSHPVSVTTPGIWPDGAALWVDYNRNGVYELSEAFRIGDNLANPVISNNYLVPASATAGVTGMRVRLAYNFYPDPTSPCEEISGFGETEEYLVNITPCVTSTITTQPPATRTISCSGTGTISATIAGSLNQYQWQVLATGAGAVWTDLTNNATYSGVTTNTLTITNALPGINGYQYRVRYSGGCTSPNVTSATTLTVGPLAPTVSNTLPINRCTTAAPTAISIATPVGLASVATTASGTLHTNIPDNNDETIGQNTNLISNNLTVNNIPAGATITGFNVKLNLTHSWVGDMIIVLKAPNGKIISLDYALSATGGPSASTGFTNTVITSANNPATNAPYPLLSSGSNPYTGTFRLDNAGPSTPGFTPTGPAGFDPNTTVLADMFQGNGTWTLAMYDYYRDLTTTNFLENWELSISYLGAPTGVFSPLAGLFTDAAGTVAYTGQPVTTVYANPSTSTTYTATVTTAVCGSGTVSIPVNVGSPLSGTSTVANNTTCLGSDATFTSTDPTGGLGATYQWQISTDNGTTWTNIAGATSATYTVSAVTNAMSGNMYRVVRTVASCTSTLTSSAGTLTVVPVPALTISAAPLTAIYPGQTTTLTVNSTTTVPAGGYQWYRNGVAVAGATGNTLVVDVDALGEYTVTAADANGCGQVSVTPPSINITSAQNDILFIYPSPNSGQFQVRYFSEPGNNPLPRYLNVYDSKGARVYSRLYPINAPYSRMDVDLTRFQDGIYQVELADRNGARIKVGRVLVQK